MRLFLPLLTFAILTFALSTQGALTSESPAKVLIIDGDSLQIGGQIFNLSGIDAPELGQRCKIESKEWRCGLEAALALRKLAAFGAVTCTSEEDGVHVRGLCQVEGKDLSEIMLGQGYAVALTDGFPAYKAAEAAARTAKLGLWRGDFIPPQAWRRGERLPGEVTDPTFCVVKAVITEKKQKIFFIPSDERYSQIEIDPERGERMFCSDDEAILQGWNRFPRN